MGYILLIIMGIWLVRNAVNWMHTQIVKNQEA
jgi:hypothetical protein